MYIIIEKEKQIPSLGGFDLGFFIVSSYGPIFSSMDENLLFEPCLWATRIWSERNQLPLGIGSRNYQMPSSQATEQ